MAKLILDYSEATFEDINDLNKEHDNLKFVYIGDDLQDNVLISGDKDDIYFFLKDVYYGGEDDFKEEIKILVSEIIE